MMCDIDWVSPVHRCTAGCQSNPTGGDGLHCGPVCLFCVLSAFWCIFSCSFCVVNLSVSVQVIARKWPICVDCRAMSDCTYWLNITVYILSLLKCMCIYEKVAIWILYSLIVLAVEPQSFYTTLCTHSVILRACNAASACFCCATLYSASVAMRVRCPIHKNNRRLFTWPHSQSVAYVRWCVILSLSIHCKEKRFFDGFQKGFLLVLRREP